MMASFRRLRMMRRATRPGGGASARDWIAVHLAAARTRLLALGVVAGLLITHSLAVTPESPEVRELVRSGVAFLKEQTDSRLGGKCVIGLAVLKATNNRRHPRVREAVKACREAARIPPPIGDEQYDVYSNGLAVVFLSELDAYENRKSIDAFLRALYARQKPHGGWGYQKLETGDTSQTQYGLLACWQAHYAGIPVQPDAVVRSLNWLLRTQDASGVWGYQGNDPGDFSRARQERTSVSMLAAGLGGTLMCSHMLGFQDLAVDEEDESDPGVDLPPAVSLVDAEKMADPVSGKAKIEQQRLEQSVVMANKWMEKNYTIRPPLYNCYYLYSIERYQSFQEVLTGTPEEEPKWYNDGYEFLREAQKDNGSWSHSCGQGVDTAFAVLFLVRSMRMSINRAGIGSGTLVGGRGLPRNVATARVRGGRILAEETTKQLGEILRVLEDPEHPDHDRLTANPRSLEVSLGEVRSDDVVRLRQLIRGGEPDVRMVAARMLARRRDLDDVPTLVYAMTDPDRRVVLAARDGLRFISRRFDGFGLPDDYTDRTRYDVIQLWKSWYLSIRPEAERDF